MPSIVAANMQASPPLLYVSVLATCMVCCACLDPKSFLLMSLLMHASKLMHSPRMLCCVGHAFSCSKVCKDNRLIRVCHIWRCRQL